MVSELLLGAQSHRFRAKFEVSQGLAIKVLLQGCYLYIYIYIYLSIYLSIDIDR